MQFHAERVSVSVAGDYYQLLLEAEEDSDDPESPYLILQRQFAVSWRIHTRQRNQELTVDVDFAKR